MQIYTNCQFFCEEQWKYRYPPFDDVWSRGGIMYTAILGMYITIEREKYICCTIVLGLFWRKTELSVHEYYE